MIKKILSKSVLILFLTLIIFISIFSTTGIETNKFNKLISNKIAKEKNIELNLNTIKFKLDLRELSLFIETQKPKINYKNFSIPTRTVKIYIDFLPIIKAEFKIKKINLILEEMNYSQIKNLSYFVKPSNFKNFLNNNIKKVKLISEIEIFVNKEGNLKDFIIKGSVQNFEAKLLDDLTILKTNFSFFSDNEDILVKNIFGYLDNIKISNGDIKVNLKDGINFNSNFDTDINLETKDIEKYNDFLSRYNLAGKVKIFKGKLNNDISISFDKTYKLKDYTYNLSGKIKEISFELFNSIKNTFITKELKQIFFSDSQINIDFSPKKRKLSSKGSYSFDGLNFLNLNLDSDFTNNLLKLSANFEYNESLNFDLINFKKPKDTVANISLNLEKEKDLLNIKKLNYSLKDDFIKISELKLKNNYFKSLKKIELKAKDNDFLIKWDKKIIIKGKKFDAINLPKFLNKESGKNKFNLINSNIEIDFKNIKIPLSENLQNFRLIGEIKKGNFVKISSKGDFGGNNFLDISMKKDKNTDKKFLEVYSDLTRPLLTEYSFFNGLSGGKLLFTSLIDESKSVSRLKIENFKVANAPGVIKLLSLADLGGLVDLAEGEGLSFDVLEIDMEKNKKFLKLNEILALGPSMSVLMEGYQDESGLTSLKGTLVPAKTLNKLISKIPVLGNIVIPKEVGEGLFGISFKMKGQKGEIKTTINPIRTLTPRFIQKIVDKNKDTK